jgi:hypothetical protein
MHGSFCLNTAGINIGIEADNMPIILQSEPAYANFILFDGRPSYDIHIRITNGPLPVISGMKELFNSSESWCLFNNGTCYYMMFQPPVFDKPYLIAEIDPGFTESTIFCSDFLIEEHDGIRSIFNPVRYPIDQIILMHHLALRSGAIIHAAGASINGKCFIFTGRSGAGKSTLSRLCSEDGRFLFLSDDRIIARRVSGRIQAFGTPWPGDEGIAINNSDLLSGIFFIYHGTENRVDRISPQQAFEKILPVTSIPWYEEESMSKMLFFCEELTSSTPAYNLFFRADSDTPDFLYTFISEITS